MTVAAKPLIAAVNHLLARESWAREKLLPYAGRRARVGMPLGSLDLVVLADGLLGPVPPALNAGAEPAGGAGSAAAGAAANTGSAASASPSGAFASAPGQVDPAFDVTITIEVGAAPAFLSGGQAGAMKYVRIEGDAEFATALGYLAEHLRWEPEEDLARIVGDAGAHRAANLARELAGRARRTGRNLLESVAEYLLDEDPQLVRRGELDTLGADLTRARDDVGRLEKRLERLERQAPQRSARAVPGAPADQPKPSDGPL
jgi:ubiquinone biosynthesis protein UbiJ